MEIKCSPGKGVTCEISGESRITRVLWRVHFCHYAWGASAPERQGYRRLFWKLYWR